MMAALASLLLLFQCISLVYSFSPPLPRHSDAPLLSSFPSSRIISSSQIFDHSLTATESDDEEANSNENEPIDTTIDPRLRRIRLSRALGIDWGTDLSFSFVYVRDLEPSGAASLSGEVEIDDQICELQSVGAKDGDEPINLIGAPFDEVMGAFANLGREVRDVDLVFFRGTKDELKALCAGGSSTQEDEKITITVIQNKGSKDETIRTIEAKKGCNMRQVLTDNNINVYQSVTRWTNCKGKQLCGTCIVNIPDGGEGTNRKSLDEASILRENPDTYRLSCVTFAYGDVTVETFPPVEAAQLTR